MGLEEVQMERQESEKSEQSKVREKGTLSEAELFRKDSVDRKRMKREAVDISLS